METGFSILFCKNLLNVTGRSTKKQYYYYTKIWNLRALMIKYFELKQQMCHFHLASLLLICSAATRTYLTMNWMGNLSINFARRTLSRTKGFINI